ncbi:hypothetical protein [Portibacter lacus]|uniref:Nuclear transport factor 2 family protein n=1 Tax=Portibacter lacus TaxID=1099794 RepID=A0AA37STL8_9BACT|nr:hypothetical protein [Portibacter lacus]GLR19937.1 hypothetical protein GCM10007940_45530 [Portibacter lacus]
MDVTKLTILVLILGLWSCNDRVSNGENAVSETNETKATTTANQELFDLIKEKDSLLFQIGFNQIDTSQVAALSSSDIEFYHDKNGITNSKNDFLTSIYGLKTLPFKTWRKLVPGSMEVFPLYKDNNKVLYGAIQNGSHDFFQQHDGETARKTNTAKFTHLWIIENDIWQLKRVLSFDHQDPK